MSAPQVPSNIDRLLNQLVDGQLSQSELEVVEKYLSENPDVRQSYYNFLDINLGVQKHYVKRLNDLDSIFTSSKRVGNPDTTKTPFLFSILGYLAVAAASVCLVLGAELLISKRFFWEKAPLVKVPPTIEKLPETYVATLVRSKDCKWGDDNRPFFSGQRLLSKELFLKEGIAEFRFDSGIRLVIEGPTEIKIESANSASLLSGSVVLHGDESAPEFELITQQAKFFDIGTLYGIKATENSGTELHVFEGSVRVLPLEETSPNVNQIQIINQGVAQYIDKNITKEIALNPDVFQKVVPESPQDPNEIQKEIIATDSFIPIKNTNKNSPSGWHYGGTGFIGPWRNWRLGLPDHTDESLPQNIKLTPAINHPQKTLHPQLITANKTGCIELKEGDIAWRTLKTPIQMNKDAIYYISIFIEKTTPPPNTSSYGQYGHFSFRTLDDLNDKKINARKILFGFDTNNRPLFSTQSQTLKDTPLSLNGKPFFLIAKIVASQNHPDQIFLRAFSQDEKIPDEEPLVWSITSAPFDDSTVYEHIRLHVGIFSAYFFDELSIGKSWKSVTNFKAPKKKL